MGFAHVCPNHRQTQLSGTYFFAPFPIWAHVPLIWCLQYMYVLYYIGAPITNLHTFHHENILSLAIMCGKQYRVGRTVVCLAGQSYCEFCPWSVNNNNKSPKVNWTCPINIYSSNILAVLIEGHAQNTKSGPSTKKGWRHLKSYSP